jgi:hypothetical protein
MFVCVISPLLQTTPIKHLDIVINKQTTVPSDRKFRIRNTEKEIVFMSTSQITTTMPNV